MRRITLLLIAALGTISCESAVLAQEAPAPTKSVSTPQILPRPDSHLEGNVGRTYLESNTPQFPQPVKAPAGAPNVVLTLLDDAGFGQFSTFGGGTPSPAMDQLASEGLRFNRFHTTALCGSTRAALITGRHSLIAGRKSLTYYPGVVGLPLSSSPPLLNKSWTITADVELPEGGGDDMICTEGGLEGGIVPYLSEGRPTFV